MRDGATSRGGREVGTFGDQPAEFGLPEPGRTRGRAVASKARLGSAPEGRRRTLEPGSSQDGLRQSGSRRSSPGQVNIGQLGLGRSGRRSGGRVGASPGERRVPSSRNGGDAAGGGAFSLTCAW